MNKLIVALAFVVSSVLVACGAAPQYHAHMQGLHIGKRSFPMCSLQGQFTCGNEFATTTAVAVSQGVIELRYQKGDQVSSERVESPCWMLEPTGSMQCGFANNAPVGSSVKLLSGMDWHSIKLTLVASDRVELDVQGAADEKSFTEIFPYPLSQETRTYLVSNGVPAELVNGLR